MKEQVLVTINLSISYHSSSEYVVYLFHQAAHNRKSSKPSVEWTRFGVTVVPPSNHYGIKHITRRSEWSHISVFMLLIALFPLLLPGLGHW